MGKRETDRERERLICKFLFNYTFLLNHRWVLHSWDDVFYVISLLVNK